MTDLALRVAATDQVVARFRTRPFDWRTRGTCLHLARAQMRALGHRPESMPDVRSTKAALLVMRRRGWDDLAAVMDAQGLERIAPLAMWPGDLALLPGADGIDALAIAAGGGTLLGYHQEAPGLVPIKEAIGDVLAGWAV